MLIFLLYSDINITGRRRTTQQMLGLKQLIFLPLKQLHTRPSRCNSSTRHEIVVSSRVSMEMRRRFREKLRQSDSENQVCPIPRYLREQEVLTSRARARPRPLLAHARHCSFTCVWKYFSVCLSFILMRLFCVAVVRFLTSVV